MPQEGTTIPDIEILMALSEIYGISINDILKADLSNIKFQIECGDIGGSVTANGYVECGDVGSCVSALNYVECGDVEGRIIRD